MRTQKSLHSRIESALKDSEAFYLRDKGASTHPAVFRKYAYRVTDTVKRAITGTLKNDPVARQYLPQNQELLRQTEEYDDPIGDAAHSPVKGIIHRYPDRALFMPANICAVYCRYCFRREKVGPGNAVLSPQERAAALAYIAAHPEIWEVILTGGDPLVLSPRHLAEIIMALDKIPHVQVLRIHTRVPIADPARITPELCAALRASGKALYIAVHVNHAQEITDESRRALSDLRAAGASLLSQSVLLKGVNDNPQILETLYRTLVRLHVKPYYLHHPDLAPGTGHFRVSIKHGQTIMRALRGRLSGLCQPTYMLDIPGGHGKVPLTPDYLEILAEGGYRVEDYQGHSHLYKTLLDTHE